MLILSIHRWIQASYFSHYGWFCLADGSLYRWSTAVCMRERTFKKKFGQALRSARENSGLSQRELAERADIADKYLSRVELGASSVSLFVAWRLTSALGLDLDALTQTEVNPSAAAQAAIAELLRGRSPEATARALRVLRVLEEP